MLPTTQPVAYTEDEKALFARAEELDCAPILVPVVERLNTITETLNRLSQMVAIQNLLQNPAAIEALSAEDLAHISGLAK